MSRNPGFDEPDQPTVAGIFKDMSSQLRELEVRAWSNDAEAIRAVAELGRDIVTTLHSIWRPCTSNAPDEATVLRRETFVSAIGLLEPFPVLHHWAGSEANASKNQARMIAEIAAGPFNLKGRPRTDMRLLVDQILLPHWRRLKAKGSPPEGLDREIWGLSSLDDKNLKSWADVFSRWLWAHPIYGPKLRDKESRWYHLADPMRALEADRTHAEMTLARAEKRACDDPSGIRETRLLLKRKRIAEMQVKDRHIKAGLKQALTGYLKRNLAGSK